MKKISGDEETVRVPKFGLADHFGKAVADGLGALTAPGPVTVRIHAPVDIGNVDKFHNRLSLKCDAGMPAVRSAQYTRIGFCESGTCQRHGTDRII